MGAIRIYKDLWWWWWHLTKMVWVQENLSAMNLLSGFFFLWSPAIPFFDWDVAKLVNQKWFVNGELDVTTNLVNPTVFNHWEKVKNREPEPELYSYTACQSIHKGSQDQDPAYTCTYSILRRDSRSFYKPNYVTSLPCIYGTVTNRKWPEKGQTDSLLKAAQWKALNKNSVMRNIYFTT